MSLPRPAREGRARRPAGVAGRGAEGGMEGRDRHDRQDGERQRSGMARKVGVRFSGFDLVDRVDPVSISAGIRLTG